MSLPFPVRANSRAGAKRPEELVANALDALAECARDQDEITLASRLMEVAAWIRGGGPEPSEYARHDVAHIISYFAGSFNINSYRRMGAAADLVARHIGKAPLKPEASA